jgi:hypothetical protein
MKAFNYSIFLPSNRGQIHRELAVFGGNFQTVQGEVLTVGVIFVHAWMCVQLAGMHIFQSEKNNLIFQYIKVFESANLK